TGYRCRLLFVGDRAQLPPVGSSYSPALEVDFLNRRFAHLDVGFTEARLTEVLRQAAGSLILSNATYLRQRLAEEDFTLPVFDLHSSAVGSSVSDVGSPVREDFFQLKGEDFEDTLQGVYGRSAREEVVFITRSNKRANMFNKAIRERVFGLEEEVSAGDLLMVVRNNYYWTEQMEKIGFLANGDMIEVLKVKQYKDLYGFRFADIEARLTDYPDEPPLELKICLDSLHVEGPSLTYAQNKQLWDEVMLDYAHLKTKAERVAAVKKDPYVNALQVKYAYALTCHKTQGGQWPTVFVDLGYFTDDMLDADFFRWLYTALTRAEDRLYLVGFDEKWML
ncbi:MAG: ATP-dependent helicase, partial [Bacteroidales bacterium]|nr:ATP-dependent helicase [Bacteroidales bacterium]